MSRNGSGVYNLPAGNPVVTGTTISSSWANTTLADIAAALTQSLSSDGQTAMTANLNMGNNKLTSLAAGTQVNDSLRWQQLFSQGVPQDIASAATVDIGAQNTNFLKVTGTTTITSFGSNYNGPRFLTFSGALTLTYNATTLILPGAANITTAAGDICIVIPKSTISGTADGWEVVSYLLAANSPSSYLTSSQLYPFLRNYIDGLSMSTAGSSTSITISAGIASDSTNTILMTLASPITKNTSIWAVGTGAGGLDTGTIAANTTYHFYEIRRPDTGVVDVVFSLNATTPTLPANYVTYRRIFSAKTNGSSQWVKVLQTGDYFVFDVPTSDISAGSSSAGSRVLVTTGVPTGITFIGVYYLQLVSAAANVRGFLTDPAQTDTAVSNNVAQLGVANTSAGIGGAPINCKTNTSGQIGVRTDSSVTYYLSTLGWYDQRGKNN